MPEDSTREDPNSAPLKDTAIPSAEDAEAPSTGEGGVDDGAVSAQEHSEAGVDALRESLATLQAELEAAQDQALRAQAEAENTRRRASRETENARKFALERFVSALLPAIDSFERAAEAAAEADAGQSVVEGVELSLKLLLGALEGAGVRVVDPAGEPFDPAFHEAMSMVTEPDMEPGSVARVIQKGYVLNERLVRAAMVMVVQAAPEEATDATSPAEPEQGPAEG